MTVICEICRKVGEMPDPWPEDADIIEKLGYRMPTAFCPECFRKIFMRDKEAGNETLESN